MQLGDWVLLAPNRKICRSLWQLQCGCKHVQAGKPQLGMESESHVKQAQLPARLIITTHSLQSTEAARVHFTRLQ